ncbi:MAG: hypothetical protein ROO71_10260 [Balneola sp.]
MRKLLLTLPVFLLIINFQTNAQESIGYSESTDFQYLIDYRLPDWGYSNFYISSANFNSSGSYRFIDQDSNNFFPGTAETDQTNYSTGLSISPRYELYKESELRTFSLNMFSSLSTNFSSFDEEETFGGSENEENSNTNSQAFQYSLSFFNDYYFSENAFLITNLFSNVRFSRFKGESERNGQPVNEQTIKQRDVNFQPSVGIGFGRIRNVTPILRSIRLNERYKELGNTSLSRSEILNTAETFTKVQGYQRTRDRFLKDFWGDVNTDVNGKLDQLNAFDLFYLNDVFSENLGSRFEGYRASLSAEYFYFNQLRNDERINDVTNRDLSISRQVHLNFEFDWFKNLNLYHQLNINVGNNLILPLEQENGEDWINQADINAEWLWVFADRFQLTTSILNRIIDLKSKDSRFQDFDQYLSRLGTNLFYFIENRMVLNAGVSLHYQQFSREFETSNFDDKRFQWSINAGIKYYFNRNLY